MLFDNDYEITRNGQFLIFEKDYQACYGGAREVRQTTIDTQGKKGRDLYKHIKDYLGKELADAAKEQGYV